MSRKKRRTREQKIIAKLRRELEQTQNLSKKAEVKIPNKKPTTLKTQNPPAGGAEKSEETLFSYDPKLIKKSLVKTLLISFIFILIIIILRLVILK